MSEGPQVLRRTEWLHKHLQARRIVRCHSARIDIPAEKLTGRTVLRAFCKGKHIFIEFDDGRFLHNHLLMKGIWRKLTGQQLFFPDTMWLALYVGPFTICNLKGQMLKLVNEDAVKLQCNSLGSDAMSLPFPRDEIYQSLGATKLAISEASLDQKVLCGVGNIAKSEARSQNLWVKSIRKSGVVSWECAGRAALSLSHSAQSRSQRRATASEAHCRRFGLEP